MSPLKALNLSEAITAIQEGETVAFPTETVYGLGASAFHLEAIDKVFQKKGRPSDNPLIVHISSLEQLETVTSTLTDDVIRLARAFWPGPLSLVLPKKETILDRVSGGLPTVAVRMPNHPLALALIQETGPLVAPSANKSGKPSPTSIAHLLEDYAQESLLYMDGGMCQIGLESTVLDVSREPYQILRPGAIGPAEILDKTGIEVTYATDKERLKHSPGVRYSHYAPKATVNWWDGITVDENSLLILHTNETIVAPHSLHVHGDMQKLAQVLFDAFRQADAKDLKQIFIEPLPETKTALREALFNRIQKAIGQ